MIGAPALVLLAAAGYGPVVVLAPEGPPSAEARWIGEAVADALPGTSGSSPCPQSTARTSGGRSKGSAFRERR